MGLFDKAKDAISDRQDDIKNQASQHSDHEDQVNDAIDKGGDAINDKTGGKASDQIDKGQDALKDKLGDL